MHGPSAFVLASASLFVSLHITAAQFAESITGYAPGTGFATDFATGQGLTNAMAALGEPSRTIPGPFGGPVDPFNPPYLPEQLVSIGTGGSLTVGFASPLANHPDHPFGLDFIIYGNAGFVITNGDFTGGGITDGSLFGAANAGGTRVSVSADNVDYFELDLTLASTVDRLFPTDGSGRMDLPVDPSLTSSSFAGLGLTDIRALYNGSAGGTGFDIGWAQDDQGRTVDLAEVRFIRVDVHSGAAEIDGFAAVAIVPEPPASWLFLSGLVGVAASAALRGGKRGIVRR